MAVAARSIDSKPNHQKGAVPLLTPEESRLQLAGYRLLVARATDVFGDAIKAARWLSSANPDFAGRPPIRIASEVNFDPKRVEELFEPIFVRIEEGIYW